MSDTKESRKGVIRIRQTNLLQPMVDPHAKAGVKRVQHFQISKRTSGSAKETRVMIPPLLSGVSHGILPELRDLALHDRLPNPNAIPGGGSTSDRRERDFDIYVKTHLDNGFIHNVEEAITVHIHKHDFLNHDEIETILDATITLNDEAHDINTCLGDAQHLLYYSRMMLRSQDPDVIQHRELFKSQYKLSRKSYKRLRSKLREYRNYVMLLWGMMAREIKRTCDIEDAAVNGAEPELAAPPYTRSP
ncbi:uncharacterized protein MELLADRAFT_102103 [Melampsora larici-populina 98AG31]|uniref:Uncharacterized protein n=1 Tax=Melampsora larici-populina (strain 98AG31 / pathotype 3-4-7) TaxID=747676 RepID=F4R607_MELLP|nr:uncharacterized protein MELLADRAFT_102103 [Melampsora larici-populina 98AG31]EGG12134.1 hypothetical protein MELLADRAFT_102103 [Melampsora larici-populina 98AG31]